MIRFKYILLLICIAVSHLAEAQIQVVLQPDASNGKDAYLRSLSPNSNYGSHYDFSAHATTSSGSPVTVRGIIEFDLSAIPAGAIIHSASLSLYSYTSPVNGKHTTISGSNAATLSRVISAWDESTVTWNNLPATTSQNQVTLPASTSSIQDYLVDVTDLVQDMVDDPVNSHGFLFKLITEQYYRRMLFASSDNADSTLHPKLEICYSPDSSFSAISGNPWNNVCAGSAIQLIVQNPQASSGIYYWYRDSCNGSYVGTGNNIFVSPGVTSTYFVRPQPSCIPVNCDSITITISTNPPAGSVNIVNGPPVVVAVNDSFELKWNAVNDAAGYQLSSNVGNSFTLNGNPLPMIITDTSAVIKITSYKKNFHLFIRPMNMCGNGARSKITWLGTIEAPENISGNVWPCSSSCEIYTADPVPGAASYQWTVSPANAATISAVTPDARTVEICYSAGFSSAQVCVIGVTTFGLNGGQHCFAVSSGTNPPSFITGPVDPCPGTSNTYTTDTLSGAVSYNWYLNGVPVSGQNGVSAQVSIPPGFTTGSVCVEAISNCGLASAQTCLSVSAGVTNVPGNIIGDTVAVCEQVKQYTLSSNAFASSYIWSVPPGATILNGQGTNAVLIAFDSTFQSGPLSVDAFFTCNAVTYSLFVDGAPDDQFTIYPLIICPGSIEVYTINSATSNISYQWVITSGKILVHDPNYTALTIEWDSLPATNQAFSVSAMNRCGSSSQFDLLQNCHFARLELDAGIILFPNPSNGTVSIKGLPAASSELEIWIYSVTGILVSIIRQESNGHEDKLTFDLGSLNSGIYFSEIRNKGNLIDRQKIIIR